MSTAHPATGGPRAAVFDPAALAGLAGIELRARYLMEGFLSGLHRSPAHGVSLEFSDYRPYQPGDDLRRLDWHLYARSDRLCMKRYHQDTNLSVLFLCDTSASMDYRGSAAWGSKMEVAKGIAAAMGWLMLRQNDAVGALAQEVGAVAPRYVRPAQRSSQLGVLLRHLEGLRAEGGECLEALLSSAVRLMPRRGMVVLVSDFLEPAEQYEVALKRLRHSGHECVLFQVRDRDEEEFPFEGVQTWMDSETGEVRVVDAQRAREQYLQRYAAFEAQQDRVFRGLEVTRCLVRTDRSPWDAMAQFLSERRRLR